MQQNPYQDDVEGRLAITVYQLACVLEQYGDRCRQPGRHWLNEEQGGLLYTYRYHQDLQELIVGAKSGIGEKYYNQLGMPGATMLDKNSVCLCVSNY